jgi:hypothetical protein
MGELEGAGEIVTGALLGRALEPHAGEGRGEGHICLNCGTALIGEHCHKCGQSGHVHRSLGGIGHELLHGVFHFEGKLWRTLPLLAWRPGELTRRYIEGERARFVSPIALFLFSIFAMFAVFSAIGLSPPADLKANANSKEMIAEARKQLLVERADAVEARDERPAGDPKRAGYERRISDADKALRELDMVTARSGMAAERGGTSVNVTTRRTGWEALDHGLEKWAKNPSLMLYKLQSNIYKFSWLLIPLSLPFVWVMFFWKRRYHLYDHAVFITYSIAFMSLLFIAIALAGTAGTSEGWVVAASFGIPFVHLLRQMKEAYQLGWFPALLRTLLLSFFITIILVVFLILLILLGSF